MESKQLKEDQYIKNWLSGIGAKKTTRTIYIDSLRAYTEFLNKTPEQIIIESEEDIKSGRLMRERNIFNDLREFREFLESSSVAPMTVKGRLTSVRSFYTFYNIQLPVLPRSSTKARPLMKHREIPTKDDLREILSVADVLEKAIVLTGTSSGLAINEISNLKVQEFLDGYHKETEITTLHLIREKVGYEFYTFLTSEATRAVCDYLKYRGRTTEGNRKSRQEQLLKQKVEYDKKGKATGYLFICRSIPSEYMELKKTKPKEAEELRKLQPINIQKMYRELNEKASKSSPSGEWNLVRSHGVRKFTYSTLLANGASIFYTDFICGHQIDNVKEAYYRADPNKLKEEYGKYAPYLIIEKQLAVSESPEYQNIKNENDILRAETARHVVERSELTELKAEMDRIKAREIEVEYNKQEIRKALATLHSTPLPELDPNATSEEREMYQKMLIKHYENQSYIKAIKMMVDMK